jgi:phosphoribosylamine--glycine ligase
LPDTKVFHAGTAERDGQVVTQGGRVLCVVGLGDRVAEARTRAYTRAATIHWPDMFFRRDIGHRALAREQ